MTTTTTTQKIVQSSLFRVLKGILSQFDLEKEISNKPNNRKGLKKVSDDLYMTEKALKTVIVNLDLNETNEINEINETNENLLQNLINFSLTLGLSPIPFSYSKFSVMVGCQNNQLARLEVTTNTEIFYTDFDNLINLFKTEDIKKVKAISHKPNSLVYGSEFFLCQSCIKDLNLKSLNTEKMSFVGVKRLPQQIEANLQIYVLGSFIEQVQQKFDCSITLIGKHLEKNDIMSSRSLFDKLNMFNAAKEESKMPNDYTTFNPTKINTPNSRGKNFNLGHLCLDLSGLNANYLKEKVEDIFKNEITLEAAIKDLITILTVIIPTIQEKAINVLSNQQ